MNSTELEQIRQRHKARTTPLALAGLSKSLDAGLELHDTAELLREVDRLRAALERLADPANFTRYPEEFTPEIIAAWARQAISGKNTT